MKKLVSDAVSGFKHCSQDFSEHEAGQSGQPFISLFFINSPHLSRSFPENFVRISPTSRCSVRTSTYTSYLLSASVGIQKSSFLLGNFGKNLRRAPHNHCSDSNSTLKFKTFHLSLPLLFFIDTGLHLVSILSIFLLKQDF